MTQAYRTAAAFKQALEQRLRTASASGVDFARRRQLVVFDRFLARVSLEFGDAVTLKGGLAMELRIERARTTKDVDLRVMGSPEDLLDRLRGAAGRDLGDFMVFTIRPDERHPNIQNDGMQYEGLRFLAECTVAGKVYGRPSASTWRSATRSSASPSSWSPRTRSRSPTSRHRRCACTPSRPTSRRSSTPTRCRALARTRG
jgi:hypothetical protein